jgi:iron complex outermembrane receptor protein
MDQPPGALKGTVTLQATGDSLHHATVFIVQLGRSSETDARGAYEFLNLPPGRYEVLAHMHPLTDERRSVDVPAGGAATLDFSLKIAPVHEHVTVTATGQEQAALEVFQSVTALDLIDLLPKNATSLGDLLEEENGVAKRSYGPGTSRPVVRGFDGDRVLILQDGMPSGTLSSQSGDHGEPVDAGTLERVEIVRGPATLLYGTNAIGGVVNVITEHHQSHQHAHEGVRGFLSGSGGSADRQAAGSGGLEVGWNKWLFLASGGGSRTGDYNTPIGKVENSGTSVRNTAASLARFGERAFFQTGYGVYDGSYGIPEIHHYHDGEECQQEDEGPISLRWRRHNSRFTGGLRNLNSWVEQFNLSLDYSDWNHKEMASGVVGTEFFNRQLIYRGVFQQRTAAGFSGSFGVNGLRRRYRVRGDEQVTPNVTHDSLALFGLEQLPLGRARLQLGGRLENNRYDADQRPSRAFTGFSGSTGLNVRLWKDGAFIASYSYSYRAPAVEELYNHGPHHGNLAYEIGDPDLSRERAAGVELGVRQSSGRVQADAGFFYYRLNDYVYLEPSTAVMDGFVVAHYRQADSRYLGGEAGMKVGLRQDLWLNLGMSAVDAQLRASSLSLPRIPPLRGRIGIELRRGSLSLRPELVLTNAQTHLYTNETRTAGYARLNLDSSYTLTRRHALHIFSVNVFNMTDKLYRNHASLIKDYAPEVGRGVRLAYTVRFL